MERISSLNMIEMFKTKCSLHDGYKRSFSILDEMHRNVHDIGK